MNFQKPFVWSLVMVAVLLNFGCKSESGTPPPTTDSTLPTVSISSPTNNATLVDSALITISASDNIGVDTVKLFIDSTLTNTRSTVPWQYSWNIRSLALNSTHTIQAKAYDAAHNVGTSSVITVIVGRPGFGGVISFRNWPPPDSVDLVVQELRIAAFKRSPIDTNGLFIEYLKGNVVIYPPVGTTAFSKRDNAGNLRDSIHYSVYFAPGEDSLRTTYSYIAVAWRYGPNTFADWRPAGLYTTNPGTFIPGMITVSKLLVPNVNIICDFRNPPPKLWR